MRVCRGADCEQDHEEEGGEVEEGGLRIEELVRWKWRGVEGGMGWRGTGTILEVEEMEVVIKKKVNCSEDERVWM